MNRSRGTRDRRTAARLPRKRLLAMNSDDRLVELVIDGDDMAFELLYARHVADALAFADGLLGSREEAEQAVRHSFAAAHAYLADGGRKTAFEPWLYTILDNHCLSVLQRRRAGAEAREGEIATVVDIEAWRRKRKLMGAALPVAPSAGFHDSVMTACGIGGGAASAAAPLLGGTLAKVAVVALLAGGAGVAGDAVSERGGPGDVAQAPPAAVVDSMAPWSAGGVVPELPRADRRADDQPERPARSPGRGPDGTEVPTPTAGEPAPAATATPIGLPPSGASVGAPAGAGVPAPAPTGVDVPAVEVPAAPADDGSEVFRQLGERLKEGLPSLEERLKTRLPSLDEPPTVKMPKLPGGVELPKVVLPPGVIKPPKVKLPSVGEPPAVGDDGDVPAAQSTAARPRERR